MAFHYADKSMMPNMVGERSIYLDYTLNHVLIIVPAIKIIFRQCVYRRILRLIDSVLSFPLYYSLDLQWKERCTNFLCYKFGIERIQLLSYVVTHVRRK